MRNFRYRSPRFSATAELAFHVGEVTMNGVCTDLSQDGISASFEQGKQEIGTIGWVSLLYSERQFTLGVVVTHQEDKQLGLAFLRRTREERTAQEQFAAYLGLQKKQSLLRQPS